MFFLPLKGQKGRFIFLVQLSIKLLPDKDVWGKSSQLGDIVYQTFGILPAEAGVGYRTAVGVFAYTLAAVLDV